MLISLFSFPYLLCHVVCGCEAKPAGGTLEKALAGGGCGHEFNFMTGAPLGTGKRGQPDNDRQYKFSPEYLERSG